MTDNAYQALANGYTVGQMPAALITRSIYVLQVSEDPQTIDMQTSLMIADADSGKLFLYDSTDTTTAHDGTSCQVDQNGRRYKLVGELTRALSVLDRLTTPPGSPSVGDAYLVIAAATGAWAGQEDDVAVYAAQGWKFIAPRIGWPLYIEDETAYYHYTAGGSWASGLGSLSLAADDVTPVEAQFWSIVSVEDVLNTPPGSPANGEAYLVDTAPTGDFSGHNGKVAYRRAGAWEFVDPYEGARLYDKDANQYLSYVGGAWSTDASNAGMQLVGTYDFGVSGHTTTIDFTGLSEALEVVVVLEDLVGTGTTLWAVQTSTDDGASFESGASDYKNQTGNSSYLPITVDAGSSVWWQTVRLIGFNSATVKTHSDSSAVAQYIRTTAEVNNAIRVIAATPSSLNVTAGKIHVFQVIG